jgi:hypothetical protein
MGIVTQNTTDSELVFAIKNSIRNLTPLSVVRCGDGEMHILKSLSDIEKGDQLVHHHATCLNLARDYVWRCPVHSPISAGNKPIACDCYLNVKDHINWRDNAREIISYAIKHADYVGLTVPGMNPRYYTISSNVLNRYGINHNLKLISSLFPREKIFGSLASFREIIQGNDIHIVTSNVDRFYSNNIQEKLGVNITYTSISGKPAHSKEIRELVKSDLQRTAAKIILFGGGYAIKDLIPWSSKEFGKISIDVGSTLDAWSGYKSRIMYEKPEFQHLIWTETQSI